MFVLVDVSQGMEKFITNLEANMEGVLNVVKDKKLTLKFIFYSDYCYMNNEDKIVSATMETGDVGVIKKAL